MAIRTPREIHPLACRCELCRPPGPATRGDGDLALIAFLAILAATALLDAIALLT